MKSKRSADAPGASRQQPSPVLGLVCMTISDEVRFRTITRTNLHKLSPSAQAERLAELYQDNAERLGRGFAFCRQLGISLYRMPSGLFPFSDTPLGAEVLTALHGRLRALGETATGTGLRLVMHPDQFAVLSSDSEDVVKNAELILRTHGELMDLLGQPRSPWAAIIIHGGKGGRGPALVERLRALPPGVRERIVLENDERAYSAEEILHICRRAEVPMVFDAHHHVIHDELPSYDDPSVAEYLRLAATTWPDPAWQLVHISNGRAGFADMAHSDFITVMPDCYRRAPWIEVEAKRKEEAILRLRESWLPA